MPNADAPEETTQLDLNLYSPDDMQSIMPLARLALFFTIPTIPV